MIPVIVVTHGNLARELVLTLQGVVGATPDLFAVCLEPQEGMEDLQNKLLGLLPRPGPDASGCLLLVDMFGGTPSNVSLALAQRLPVQVITGVNLPMILEAVLHHAVLDLPALAELVERKGRDSIIRANTLIPAAGTQEDSRPCP